MSKKGAFSVVILIILTLICSSAAVAQYELETEPTVEAIVGVSMGIPVGHIKNDLEPSGLNATTGIGLKLGAGYYLNPKLILGLYFDNRNMDTDSLDLVHRVFNFGLYGKYMFSESNFFPYIKGQAALNFSKMVTEVVDDGQPKFRELSYDQTLGLEVLLGIEYQTNSYGGIFLEAGYHFDMMSGNTGDFEGDLYEWPENNAHIVINAGVIVNLGGE